MEKKNNALAYTHTIEKKEKLTQNYDNNWAMMENVQYETDSFSRFKSSSFQYACFFIFSFVGCALRHSLNVHALFSLMLAHHSRRSSILQLVA